VRGVDNTRLWPEKGMDLVEETTETCCRAHGLEPESGPIALFHVLMGLLQMMIQGVVGSVHHPASKDVPNGFCREFSLVGHLGYDLPL
jgi:hypothetical protein